MVAIGFFEFALVVSPLNIADVYIILDTLNALNMLLTQFI